MRTYLLEDNFPCPQGGCSPVILTPIWGLFPGAHRIRLRRVGMITGDEYSNTQLYTVTHFAICIASGASAGFGDVFNVDNVVGKQSPDQPTPYGMTFRRFAQNPAVLGKWSYTGQTSGRGTWLDSVFECGPWIQSPQILVVGVRPQKLLGYLGGMIKQWYRVRVEWEGQQ